MIDEVKWIIGITNDEYNGNSYNGDNLVKTVSSYSLAQLKDKNTEEGYSVWSVFLHVAYHKWMLIKFIDPENPMDYPWEQTPFQVISDSWGEKEWKESLSLSDALHNEYIRLVSNIKSEKLPEVIKVWQCSIGKAIAWASTHDAYHTAQIRNMKALKL